MTERNAIHNRNFLDNGLPDHCADIIIADPPYYKVKGEFDKVWPDFDAYLADVEAWAKECARLLAHTGTLVWFGSWRRIAYSQIILDRYFDIINNCTVFKENGIQNLFANMEVQRSFFSNDERFLVYESACTDPVEGNLMEKNRYAYDCGMLRTRIMQPLVDYLVGERDRAGFTSEQVGRELGTCMQSHWFTRRSQFALPTAENYARLRRLFNRDGGNYLAREYDDLAAEYKARKAEYETARKEYESGRRPFRMERRQSDVFTWTWDCGASKRYGHSTVKDVRLAEYLVRCFKPMGGGGLLVAPFAGSGTECLAAARNGMDYVGYEIDAKSCEIARARLENVELRLI